MLGREARKRLELEEAIESAKAADAAINKKQRSAYKKAYSEWEHEVRLAEGVLSGNVDAYRAALDWADSFSELEDLGCPVNVVSCAPWYVEASIQVNSDDIVPDEIKSLTAAGKVSSKKMPATKSAEIYQDYVCGAVLRVGREILAALPVSMAIVHAVTLMVNSETGHQQIYPILSVAMPRKTMDGLNFLALDPSNAMRGFTHKMSFHKSKGMSAIEPLKPNDFQRSA